MNDSPALTPEDREEFRSQWNKALDLHLQPDTEAVDFIIISADGQGMHEGFGLIGSVNRPAVMTSLISTVIRIGETLGVSPRVTTYLKIGKSRVSMTKIFTVHVTWWRTLSFTSSAGVA